MCVYLYYLKYSHIVGSDTQYLGLQRNMKMRDIAWVSGRNTFITENINTLITGWKILWSLIEENLGLAAGFSEVRAALAICPNLEAIKDVLKQHNHSHHNYWTHHDHNDCHNHRSKLITILLLTKGTILTPRTGISMDTKLSDCRMSDRMIAPLTDVQSSDCQMVLQNSDPFHHDRYHHHHHCQLHPQRSDCDHICADVRLFDVESLEFEERKNITFAKPRILTNNNPSSCSVTRIKYFSSSDQSSYSVCGLVWARPEEQIPLHWTNPENPQNMDGKAPAITQNIQNYPTTNLVGGWIFVPPFWLRRNHRHCTKKNLILPSSRRHPCRVPHSLASQCFSSPWQR